MAETVGYRFKEHDALYSQLAQLASQHIQESIIIYVS